MHVSQQKDNTVQKQDAQSNQHMNSKTDDISERELNSQIDYISRIKTERTINVPKEINYSTHRKIILVVRSMTQY